MRPNKERLKEIKFHANQFHHNSTAIDDVQSEEAILELLAEIDVLTKENEVLTAKWVKMGDAIQTALDFYELTAPEWTEKFGRVDNYGQGELTIDKLKETLRKALER